MSNLLALFKPRKPAVSAKDVSIIAVPDIKEYLVKEYERGHELVRQNEMLREQVERCRELGMKYDATLVTLDEYSARLEKAQVEIQRERDRTANARQEADKYRDLVNSYKIQFNNAAVTKEQIKDEIISEVKADIIKKINGFKGNLSKKIVCAIILGEMDGAVE